MLKVCQNSWKVLRSDDVYEALHESHICQHVIDLAFQYICDWDVKSSSWTWRYLTGKASQSRRRWLRFGLCVLEHIVADHMELQDFNVPGR